MKKLIGTLAALVVALSVTVPAGFAGDGQGQSRGQGQGQSQGQKSDVKGDGPKQGQGIRCGHGLFLGNIVSVGTDGLVVRPGRSGKGRTLTVGLTADTKVWQARAAVDRSTLAAGQLARFAVRGCKGGDRRTMTAKLVVILPVRDPAKTDQATPPAEAPATGPKPGAPVCGRGETNAAVVSASSSSITLRAKSKEGVKDWSASVDGDTVVQKGGETVDVAALNAGDLVHVVIVRCTTGGARALRVVFVGVAPTSS